MKLAEYAACVAMLEKKLKDYDLETLCILNEALFYVMDEKIKGLDHGKRM